MSITRPRSLLAMTAVRLPGRLRGGGKVLLATNFAIGQEPSAHRVATISLFIGPDSLSTVLAFTLYRALFI